jgi:hypothetical protein
LKVVCFSDPFGVFSVSRPLNLAFSEAQSGYHSHRNVRPPRNSYGY